MDTGDALVRDRFSAGSGLSSFAAMVMKDLGMFICVLVITHSSDYTVDACQTQATFLYALPSWVLCALCVLVVRGTQVCVITSVIRAGYGPPASK